MTNMAKESYLDEEGRAALEGGLVLLTRKQAASYLGVCLTVLDRQTTIPKLKFGRTVRYERGSLDAWIRANLKAQGAEDAAG